MNRVIVYHSKYGSTKKFAKWLGKMLNCSVYHRKLVTIEQLEGYDCIIYGGPIYAGHVNGLDIFTRYQQQLENKKLVVFTCGLSDPSLQDVIETRNSEVQAQLKSLYDYVKVFHLRGAIDYKKLQLSHRIVMHFIHRLQSSDTSSNDKKIVATYNKSVDFTNQEQLIPIVEYVNQLK